MERPKLNLRPRLQPIEQLEGNIEKERNALFGARPRELVLRERAIDDSNQDLPFHHLCHDSTPFKGYSSRLAVFDYTGCLYRHLEIM